AGKPVAPRPPERVDDDRIEQIAEVLRSGEPAAVLLGPGTTAERGLLAASRIAAATGAKIFVETFPARLERGVGLPAVERLGYLAEQVQWQLTDVRHLVLVGAKSPVSFFAYPGKPSELIPEGCQAHVLAVLGEATAGALAH